MGFCETNKYIFFLKWVCLCGATNTSPVFDDPGNQLALLFHSQCLSTSSITQPGDVSPGYSEPAEDSTGAAGKTCHHLQATVKYWLCHYRLKTPNLNEAKNYHISSHSLPTLMVQSNSLSSFFFCLGCWKKISVFEFKTVTKCFPVNWI